jgi:predicted lipoprotein with Yx(FWY)xxD motif/plastocyanin
MKSRLGFPIFLTLILLLTACASAAPTQPAAQPTQPPAAPSATTAPIRPIIQLGQSANVGSFLVDAKGMTLYLFTKDTPNTTVCYDDCAVSWPPLLVEGAPVAGPGVDASKLGLTQRKDGASQATYNGWPLYYFAKDMKPGDTNGQGVGGVWYAISAAGDKVEAAMQIVDEPIATMTVSNTEASNTNANSNENSAVAGSAVSVDIRDFAFDPTQLTITVGTTVTWENKDSARHNVVADNGEFKSGALDKDGEFSFTFTKAGTYPYYCTFHGGPGGKGMSGQVIVTP